ncbi:MAG TPA: hypothetical protein VHR66_19135 [Gemmataceae bacterium]|jgi:hypothetical protein|nr:hypothetical protein [Gemmataceae bacterium]
MRIGILSLWLITLPVWAEDKVDTAKVEEQARLVGKAFLDSDWAKMADLTYPKVVEMNGGREKMIETVEKGMKRLKDQGYSFKKYTVATAQIPVVDGKTIYVVVPTSLEIEGPTAKAITDSYLLAVSTDSGKTWTFADGAGIADPEKRKLVFPSLPAGLKLPDRKPPKVIKD